MSNKEFYVSLTSIPNRFHKIYKTIDSLINQSLLPTIIYINICKKYNFRFNGQSIVKRELNRFIEYYKDLPIVKLNIIDEDYGPGSKLIGALKIENISPESYIILADDDRIYYKDFIKDLVNSSDKEKNIVKCFSMYICNDTRIFRGTCGVVIKKEYLLGFLEYFERIKHDKRTLAHDDMYISYFLSCMNTNIEMARDTIDQDNFKQHCNEESLCKLKGIFSRTYLNYYVILKLKKDYKLV